MEMVFKDDWIKFRKRKPPRTQIVPFGIPKESMENHLILWLVNFPTRASGRALFGSLPERTDLSDLCQGGYHFSGVFLFARDPIEIHPSTEVWP